jgi:hypothetical protein
MVNAPAAITRAKNKRSRSMLDRYQEPIGKTMQFVPGSVYGRLSPRTRRRIALIDPWQPALLLPGPVAALEAYIAAEMVIQFRAPFFEQTAFRASAQLTLAMRKHLP